MSLLVVTSTGAGLVESAPVGSVIDVLLGVDRAGCKGSVSLISLQDKGINSSLPAAEPLFCRVVARGRHRR